MSYGMGGCCQYNELMPFPPRFSLDSVLFGMMMLFLWAAIFAFRGLQHDDLDALPCELAGRDETG